MPPSLLEEERFEPVASADPGKLDNLDPGGRGQFGDRRMELRAEVDVAGGLDGPKLREGYDEGGPERLLDLTLRTGPFGDRYGEDPDGLTLDKVKAEPHGIDLGPNVSLLADVLQTPNGKVVLAPVTVTPA